MASYSLNGIRKRSIASIVAIGCVVSGLVPAVMWSHAARAADAEKPAEIKVEEKKAEEKPAPPKPEAPKPAAPAPAPKPPPPPLSEQVDKAITKGIEYLWSQQNKASGLWYDTPTPPVGAEPAGLSSQWGGTTALVTYALLAAGENRDDKRFVKPIEFLRTKNITGIYALGMRANVWPFLNSRSPQIREAIGKDYKLLLAAAHAAPDVPGAKAFYRYSVTSTDYDHSASQYGVLGMWAIDAVGGEVPEKYWKAVEEGWRKHQGPDGGWSYEGKGESKATMTAAGLATLFITQDFLHGNDGIECPGNVVDTYIDKGLKWEADHWKEVAASGYYGYYGVERIGVASGYKYFGEHDWYQEIAQRVVRDQQPNGSWPAAYGPSPIDTSFALLFLVRGRAPVAVNKLQYAIDTHGDKPKVANWNQRPRDVANMTKWIGKETERFLNWQIVNLTAPVEDMHDAPLLYMSGNQAVVLADKDVDKLRQYVQEGGLIAANADCNNADFATFFQNLGKQLFKDQGYQWAPLPPEHVVFNEQWSRDKWPQKPPVLALTNGARVLMVLLPTDKASGDYGRNWQLQLYGGHQEAYELMDNLFLYAVDKGDQGGLRNKGETFIVRKSERISAVATVLNVARLKYDGNWNPEPAGWPRIGAIAHNNAKAGSFDIDPQPVELGKGKLDAKAHKLAHLTGTAAVKLAPEALSELKKFIADGGTLLVDAAGGNGEFAQSMDAQLAGLTGGGGGAAGFQPVPLTSPAFTGPMTLKEGVEYRRFARKVLGNTHTPRLKGLTVNGRTAVYFSAEDLTVGLVGEPVDGIIGYAPQTATSIVYNIAYDLAKPPVPHPATAPGAKPAAPPPAAAKPDTDKQAKAAGGDKQ